MCYKWYVDNLKMREVDKETESGNILQLAYISKAYRIIWVRHTK